MKRFDLYIRYIILLIWLQPFAATAQLLPAKQPEQDPCNALPLCGNTFFTPYSYQGFGAVMDLSTTPCGSNETNSVWLRLAVKTAGSIVFTITPVAVADDYDFAIANITGGQCDKLTQSQIVRCNFNNNQPVFNNGIVGLNTTSTLTNVMAGTTGSSFLKKIDAVAGDVYLIMINNYGTGGGPSSGFTIDFSGTTAQFVDNNPAEFSSLSSESACESSRSVILHLNTAVSCNSIAADGSDFFLKPAGSIKSAQGINCSGANGYTKDIKIEFLSGLIAGNYTLYAQKGTDNNTLLNLCNTPLAPPDSLTFVVGAGVQYKNASFACTTLTLQTDLPVKCNSVATDGSDFRITGPGPIGVAQASATSCASGYTNSIHIVLEKPVTVSGTYTLWAQRGSDGNTLTDSCDNQQAISDKLTFNAVAAPVLSLPDSTNTCVNTGTQLMLTLTNSDPSLKYEFSWTPVQGLTDNTIAQPVAAPRQDQWYVVTAKGNNPTMCSTQDSIFVHSLQGFTLWNKDTVICEGQSVQVMVDGSDEYTYAWTPTKGVSDSLIRNPVIRPATSTQYYLTASYPGCRDSIAGLNIEMMPNPVALRIVADRTTICSYDTAILYAVTTPASASFSYTWTPAKDLLYNQGANNAFWGDSTQVIRVTAANDIGCSATDSIRIVVYPAGFSRVNTKDTAYCIPGFVRLEASGGQEYNWSPNYGLSDTTGPIVQASPQTTTTYRLLVKDDHGCVDSQQISVTALPAAVLTMPDSVMLYPGESYHIVPVSNCSYFEWFPPSGLNATKVADPYASPEVRTRYYVTATTEKGCGLTDSLDVLVAQTTIDLPNAFQPSGSGEVARFRPSRRGIARLNSFRIFNRWGILLYESNDIDEGWDGRFKGVPQPMGVYLYTIDAVTDLGRQLKKEGDVTLIR